MILASDIVSGAYQLLGRPSQNDLPYLDVLDHTRDVIRARMLDLKLAVKGHTQVVGGWVTPSSREMSASSFTGGSDNVIPLKVQWLNIGEDSDTINPRTAIVVSFENLNDLSEKAITDSETYVAFYNGFSEIAFSESVETLNVRQYRVIYEDMDDPSFSALTDNALLPSIFITLCKYELALVCLNQVRNLTDGWADERERLRTDFVTQVQRWSQKFDKWKTSQYGQKKVRKQGFRVRY